jgi:hypothetical protein
LDFERSRKKLKLILTPISPYKSKPKMSQTYEQVETAKKIIAKRGRKAKETKMDGQEHLVGNQDEDENQKDKVIVELYNLNTDEMNAYDNGFETQEEHFAEKQPTPTDDVEEFEESDKSSDDGSVEEQEEIDWGSDDETEKIDLDLDEAEVSKENMEIENQANQAVPEKIEINLETTEIAKKKRMSKKLIIVDEDAEKVVPLPLVDIEEESDEEVEDCDEEIVMLQAKLQKAIENKKEKQVRDNIEEYRKIKADEIDAMIAEMVAKKEKYLAGEHDEDLVKQYKPRRVAIKMGKTEAGEIRNTAVKTKFVKGGAVTTLEGVKVYDKPKVDRKLFAKTFFRQDLLLVGTINIGRGKSADKHTHAVLYDRATDTFKDLNEEYEPTGKVFENLSKAVQYFGREVLDMKNVPNPWKTYRAFPDEQSKPTGIDIDRLDSLEEDSEILARLI